MNIQDLTVIKRKENIILLIIWSVSNSGDYGAASNSGDCGAASNSGDYGVAITTGYTSMADAQHKNSIAVAFGRESRAKGVFESWIVCTEFKKDENGIYYPADVQVRKVDGEIIKEDTYYMLKDGDFVETDK